MRARDRRGFTLLELLIALAIVAALLAIAFGGLRVAIAAWSQGEDRAEAHQHLRGVGLIVSRALGAAAPYRAPRGAAPEATLLFRGTERGVEFVTQAPPFPPALPVAFTAVIIELEEGAETALVVRQRVLPNREPFSQARPVLRDPGVHDLQFRYLDEGGGWRDAWDAGRERRLPRAVRITLATRRGGRTETLPPLTVAIRTVGR